MKGGRRYVSCSCGNCDQVLKHIDEMVPIRVKTKKGAIYVRRVHIGCLERMNERKQPITVVL